MNKNLAWGLLPTMLLTSGCCSTRRTPVASAPAPVIVQPAVPAPFPTLPPAAPPPATSGYYSGNPPCPQPAPQGFAPSHAPNQGFAPSHAPSAPPQGFAPQGAAPQGFAPQGSPPQGSPPQGSPPQGSPPQGSPPQGSPPQGFAPNPNPGLQNSFQPAPQIQLSPPEKMPPEPRKESPEAAPAGKGFEPARPGLPSGIPQFGMAREGIAGGLRPSLDEGLDWLQTNGYKTVLHIRQPGEVDDADRKQVEKRGMKYLSLEVSPQTLNRKTLDEFAGLVAAKELQPMFVYDREGALAGGLWYWYFRTIDMQTDDAARVRAGALGLRESRMGLHTDMWLALQKLLADR